MTKKFFIKNRYQVLLTTIVSLFLLSPTFDGQISDSIIANIFETGLFLSTINLFRRSNKVGSKEVLLGILTFSLIWIDLLFNVAIAEALKTILMITFFYLALRIVIHELTSSFKVDKAHIFGAIVAYFLLGFLWGNVFQLIELVHPNSFKILYPQNSALDLNYFSFVTLLTLGYGDVFPIAQFAKILCVLEGITGQFFMAVLVGRIVGLHINNLHEKK